MKMKRPFMLLWGGVLSIVGLLLIMGTQSALANTPLNQTVPVGVGPVGVAVNQVTNKAYVSNQGEGTISVRVAKGRAILFIAFVKA